MAISRFDLGGHGRVLSKPVAVHWMGFESDTFKLQSAGWEICMEQNVEQRAMRMVMRHPRDRIIAQTNDIPMEVWGWQDRAYENPYTPWGAAEVWQLRMGQSINVRGINLVDQYARFTAVDCKPEVVFEEVKDLEDLVPFKRLPTLLTKTLILPEATVDDLLSGILARQQPDKTRYFEELVRKEKAAGKEPQVSAQIITLPRAIAA